MQYSRIFLDAPLAFLAAVLLGCAAAYLLAVMRFQGAADQKAAFCSSAAAIDSLNAQIDILKDRLRKR